MFLNSCVIVKPGLRSPSPSFGPQVLESQACTALQATHSLLSVNGRSQFLEGALLLNTAPLASSRACCVHTSPYQDISSWNPRASNCL